MAEVCERCNLAHPSPRIPDGLTDAMEKRWINRVACSEAQALAMKALLDNIGDPGACRGCQAPIYWVTHRNGKKTPYDSSGLNHFINCEARDQFRRPK